MAAITRRTFASIRDEALKRCGRYGNTDASTRMEYRVEQAYLALALTYHHFELDATVSGQVVSAASVSTALPSDVYVVAGVTLLDFTGTFIQRLVRKSHASLLGSASSDAAVRPKFYSRWGSVLEFPAPTDVAYRVNIAYYRRPNDVDMANSSELDPMWDEAIIQYAAGNTSIDVWAPDVGGPELETLNAFLARVVNIEMRAGSVGDVEEASTTDRPHGGPQG